jgi:hypothetical protein
MMKATAIKIGSTLFLLAAMGLTAETLAGQGILDKLKKAAEDAGKNQPQQQKPANTPAQPAKPPAAPAQTQPAAQPPAQTNAGTKPAAQQAQAPVNLPGSPAKVESQLLVNGEPNLKFVISTHGSHLAAVTSKGSRVTVTEDGMEGPRFDEILVVETGTFAFSRSGAHLGYVGRVGTEWAVMLDQKEIARGPYTAGMFKKMGFVPGEKHFYFQTLTFDGSRSHDILYIDGKPGPESNAQIEPLFSPDGEHYSYNLYIHPLAGQDSYPLIIDGKPATYQAGVMAYSGDSQHLFTKAQLAGAVAFLVDGKEFLRASEAQFFAAPAGNGFVSIVTQGADPAKRIKFLVIGTQKVPGSDCPWAGASINSVIWSPDGKHWAVKCQATQNSYWVMADGKKGLEYQNISEIDFTADGKPVYMATNNLKNYMVVGEDESAGYARILTVLRDGNINFPALIAGNTVAYSASPTGSGEDLSMVVGANKPIVRRRAAELTLSPDGAHYAFTWVDGVNLDGTDMGTTAVEFQRPSKDNGQGSPRGYLVFSPDGTHLAFFTRHPQTTEFGIVIDGKFLAGGRGLTSNLQFTPDGKHLVWIDRMEGNLLAIYIDGKVAAQYDPGAASPWGQSGNFEIGADGVISAITQDGDTMKRLRVTPPADSSVDTLAGAAKALPKK